MILYRPVGEAEYGFIVKSGYTAFPPRLPEQPVFYPVLNQQYAEETASQWNTKDKHSGYKGYGTRFEVDSHFMEKYEVQAVGRSYHQEYWIPAEALEEFNRHILGKIEVVKTFTTREFVGSLNRTLTGGGKRHNIKVSENCISSGR